MVCYLMVLVCASYGNVLCLACLPTGTVPSCLAYLAYIRTVPARPQREERSNETLSTWVSSRRFEAICLKSTEYGGRRYRTARPASISMQYSIRYLQRRTPGRTETEEMQHLWNIHRMGVEVAVVVGTDDAGAEPCKRKRWQRAGER